MGYTPLSALEEEHNLLDILPIKIRFAGWFKGNGINTRIKPNLRSVQACFEYHALVLTAL